MSTPRERFLACVRGDPGCVRAVSPFLPHADVVRDTLARLGLPFSVEDPIGNEVRLGKALGYEPMFMTEFPDLLFPWREDPARSDGEWIVSTLETRSRVWTRRVSRRLGQWGDEGGFPVRNEADHALIREACAEVGGREGEIRRYFRDFRRRVGEDGVIVIGHPHVTWLCSQASQQNLVFHSRDFPVAFRASMEAILEAALFVFAIAISEGIDFMSESSSGLEMTSPAEFEAVDLPYLRRLSEWTHRRGGLVWYHNCGLTRRLILDGRFNEIGADVLETVAPPPEGDNDLAESRHALDRRICTKGNLNLTVLRDGTEDAVRRETRAMAEAVRGWRHVLSTADAVLPGTPPGNLIAFVETARGSLP